MAKRSVKRSPWANLARAIQDISPALGAKEVDRQAWTIWFNQTCPLSGSAIAAAKEPDACLNELYEQTSGKFVKEDEEEEEDTPKE